jgi:hypothetical protein
VKAVLHTQYGSPELLQLKEIQTPVPKDNKAAPHNLTQCSLTDHDRTTPDKRSFRTGEEEAPSISSARDVFASDISPDGRWIAYHSVESGRTEVYARPFPLVDSGRWQVSNAGGTRPRWSRDGHELFYFTPADGPRAAALWAVPITPGPTLTAGRPVKVFEGNYGAFNQGRQTYDVSPDGKRFVMIQPVETPTPIIVVQNWTDELKRRVPTN